LPEPFGAGIFTDTYRGTFTPDGDTFYFFRPVGGTENYRIFSSQRSTDGWSAPVRVNLGGDFSDLYPSIAKDGRRMAFSSYRPIPGDSTGKPNAHVWYVDRTDRGWGPPVFVSSVSTPGHYHSWIEIGADDALYLRRTTPDWKKTESLRAPRIGTAYGAPTPYTDVERWKGWRTDVTVAGGSPGPNASLVFLDVATRNPATGQPASDIWVVEKRDGAWSEPRPLSRVNSDGFDVFPFFSPDGRDLYFVRDFSAFYRIPLAAALGG
jgi:Tol biopolymer transport system component